MHVLMLSACAHAEFCVSGDEWREHVANTYGDLGV